MEVIYISEYNANTWCFFLSLNWFDTRCDI